MRENIMSHSLSEATSHCMNCGAVVRRAVPLDDKRINLEFCNFCEPFAGRAIAALDALRCAGMEYQHTLNSRSSASSIKNAEVIRMRDTARHNRELNVALDDLRVRQIEMNGRIAKQARSN
jgi:hypothetical protein